MKLHELIQKILEKENDPGSGIALLSSGNERETRIWWEDSYWTITQTSMEEFEIRRFPLKFFSI